MKFCGKNFSNKFTNSTHSSKHQYRKTFRKITRLDSQSGVIIFFHLPRSLLIVTCVILLNICRPFFPKPLEVDIMFDIMRPEEKSEGKKFFDKICDTSCEFKRHFILLSSPPSLLFFSSVSSSH